MYIVDYMKYCVYLNSVYYIHNNLKPRTGLYVAFFMHNKILFDRHVDLSCTKYSNPYARWFCLFDNLKTIH